MCGAFLSGLSFLSLLPVSTARISSRIVSSAVTKRSSSSFDSLSVGSTIKVPTTGKLIVGAWKPKSIRRLAMSSTSMPDDLKPRVSKMHSWATKPPWPV